MVRLGCAVGVVLMLSAVLAAPAVSASARLAEETESNLWINVNVWLDGRAPDGVGAATVHFECDKRGGLPRVVDRDMLLPFSPRVTGYSSMRPTGDRCWVTPVDHLGAVVTYRCDMYGQPDPVHCVSGGREVRFPTAAARTATLYNIVVVYSFPVVATPVFTG